MSYPSLSRIPVVSPNSVKALSGYTGAAFSYRAVHYLPKCDHPEGLISHLISSSPPDALPNDRMSSLIKTLSRGSSKAADFVERSGEVAAEYRAKTGTPLEMANNSVLLFVPESAQTIINDRYKELKPKSATTRVSADKADALIEVCLAAVDLVLVSPRFSHSELIKEANAVLTEAVSPSNKLAIFTDKVMSVERNPILRLHIRVVLAYMHLIHSEYEKAAHMLADIDYLAYLSGIPASANPKPIAWKDISGLFTLEEVLSVALLTSVHLAARDFSNKPIIMNIIENYDYCSIISKYLPSSPLATFLDGWNNGIWYKMQQSLCEIAELMALHPLLAESFDDILNEIHHFFIDYYMAPYSCVSILQIMEDFKETQKSVESLLIWLIKSGRFVGRLNIVDMTIEREEKEERSEAAEIVNQTAQDTVDMIDSINLVRLAPAPPEAFRVKDFDHHH